MFVIEVLHPRVSTLAKTIGVREGRAGRLGACASHRVAPTDWLTTTGHLEDLARTGVAIGGCFFYSGHPPSKNCFEEIPQDKKSRH